MLLYSILATPLIALLAFVLIQPIKVLPRISLAPGFALTDQDGNRLTNEDLRGSLTLYTFTYTNCGDGCAQTGPGMKAVQEAVAAVDTGGIPVQLVTISFDPERDSPAVLRQYADALGADTSNWHFVTGEPTRLKNVIGRGFSTFTNSARTAASSSIPPSCWWTAGASCAPSIVRTRRTRRSSSGTCGC
ncbi:MAG: SCO family protein [Caldilineaceae bacterium]